MNQLKINQQDFEYQSFVICDQKFQLELNAQKYCGEILKMISPHCLLVRDQQGVYELSFYENAQGLFVNKQGRVYLVELPGRQQASSQAASGLELLSPMPGKVFKILKDEGSAVKAGEDVLLLEAMKMEHPIKALQDGIVEKIYKKVGEQVSVQEILVKLKEA